MKAISLWEPWASLVRNGIKTVETRSWKTNYRGELLVCAAKKRVDTDIEYDFELNYGKAVAIVKLIDCIPTDNIRNRIDKDNLVLGDFSSGRCAWIFDNIRVVDPPFEVKGSQGLFNVEVSEYIKNRIK